MSDIMDTVMENDILEWSEQYGINNDALCSLIEILIRNSCGGELNKYKKVDQSTQSEFLDLVSNSITENYTLEVYLEDLRQTQKEILKEVVTLRKKSNNCCPNYTKNKSIYLKNKRQKIFDFPLKSLKHFQRLETACEKNEKLYNKLIDIFLSNTKNLQIVSIDDFFEINFKIFVHEELISDIASHFCEIIESSAISRGFKDAAKTKFTNHTDKELYASLLNCLRKFSNKEDDCQIAINYKNDEGSYYERNKEESVQDLPTLLSEPLLIDCLPCTSIKDLLKFEQQCKKVNNFENILISLFKSGPKTDYKNFVWFAMKKIFDKEVVDDIDWEDVSESKTEIKDFKVIEVLIDYTLHKFDKINSADDVIDLITQWIKNNQKSKISSNIKIESNIIKLDMTDTPEDHINEIEGNETEDEICVYNEEFLEEENLLNLLPCQSEISLQKLEEICRLDLSTQKRLKQLFQSTFELDRINFKNESDDTESFIQLYSSYEIENDFKQFIKYNIRKIASNGVIRNFIEMINIQEKIYPALYKYTKQETNLDYNNIIILKILHECVKETYPNLSDNVIRHEIESFIYKTKKNLKNWTLIKKSEECRMKVKSIASHDIITPVSHSIHLQSILNLPLNSFDCLREFNMKCLNDEEMSLKLVSMFLQVSETDFNKFVDKNLRKLITENMGGKLTWNGIQDNIAVKDFHIMKLLIDAAKRYYINLGEEKIIESIKLALRRFKDRIRKRKCSVLSIENLMNEDTITYSGILNDSEELQNDSELQPIDKDIINLKKIPCKSIEEFKNFEKYCKKSKDLQINLKFLFDSNNNDKDAVKFISDNLKKIVTDSTLGHFTYNGLKNNIGVKYYTIIRILMDSLIGKEPYLSEEDVIKDLKKALLLAKDRQRSLYKKRRRDNIE